MADHGRSERRGRLPVISVRARLVAAITIVAAIGLLVVGLTTYSVERQRILTQVDELLAGHLESARFLVNEGPSGGGEWPSSADALRDVVKRISPDDNTGAVGLIDGAVALVPGVPLEVDLADARDFVDRVDRETAGGDAVIGTFTEGDVAWRYLATPITAGEVGGPPAVFAMVYDVRAEIEEIDLAARVYLISALLALVVIALVAWVVAGRLLRPLREMRTTAERVSARSLSERIPVHGRDDVSDLARTMNDMLDRLDDALDSQRRLVGDVGHELKTPITIVRGYLEVMDLDDPRDVRETQALAIDELERMGGLVQDLANAAALHGPSPIKRVPVDTADLLRQIVRKADAIDGAHVRTGLIADVVADIDPARITQAMLQLAQNAVTHGGGDIVLGSRIVDDRLELWVRDYGDGVPDLAKETIFERFERGSGDSAPDAPGSGLGLHIVQVIARAHGGTVAVLDAERKGAVFVLRVPISATTGSTAATDVPQRDDVAAVAVPEASRETERAKKHDPEATRAEAVGRER